MMSRSVPTGGVSRFVGGTEVVAHTRVVDALATVIQEHGTLYEWAAERPQPRALRGRAPVFVATLPTVDETIVVRHAWHGGLLAPLSRDLFRMPTRAPLEFAQSQRLRDANIPTTEVLGFARYKAEFGFRRVDVVSRFIPDAYDLGMIAAGLAPQIDRDAALSATIELLVKLAAIGVVHPDLNVKNVLVRHTRRDALEAMMIDVDVVRWDPHRQPIDVMRRNVTRLLRSMRKWRTHFGCDVADARMLAFEREALAAASSRPAGNAIASVPTAKLTGTN